LPYPQGTFCLSAIFSLAPDSPPRIRCLDYSSCQTPTRRTPALP